jgi:putative ATP-dependent endonuclease of OLD family
LRIRRIAFEGFCNFRKLEFDDLRPAIVLVGANRSGKSNLIHALRLVLYASLPDSARQLAAVYFWDGLPTPFDGHQITIVVGVAGFDGDHDATVIRGDSCVSTGPKIARLTYVYRPRPDATTQLSEADYEPIIFDGVR